jgi:hypothetical protein
MAPPRLVNEVSLGSVVSIVTILGAVIGITMYVAGIERAQTRDATSQQVRIDQIEARINRADAQVTSQVREVKNETAQRLDRIEGKLDRLIEAARQ